MKRCLKITFISLFMLLAFTVVSNADSETTTGTVMGTSRYDYAAQVVSLVNQQRTAAGVSTLTVDAELTEAAMQRAAEITQVFEHTRPDGTLCFSILEKLDGENIAMGYTTASSVMNGWMNSTMHRYNILGSSYKSIGVGCVQVNGTLYWVQLFSYSASSSTAVPSTAISFTRNVTMLNSNGSISYSSSTVANLIFDYKYYADTYADVKAAWGYNESKLKEHWLNYGIKEGRSPSKVYDPDYYVENNADLKAAFGTNYTSLYNHFINYGYAEYRPSSSSYSGTYYKAKYSDLSNFDGFTLIYHYLNHGASEGRKANVTAKQNITNYLFNAQLYYDLYADLRTAFGYDEAKLKAHWLSNGIKEGRIASFVFDAKYYLDTYADLKAAFGNDYTKAYNHFINNGIHEGRSGSQYFEVKYYLNKYSDLQKAYDSTYSAVLVHFVKCGLSEGRESSSKFSISVYKTYNDLKNAFGNSIFSYYEHYIKFGIKEGRKCV